MKISAKATAYDFSKNDFGTNDFGSMFPPPARRVVAVRRFIAASRSTRSNPCAAARSLTQVFAALNSPTAVSKSTAMRINRGNLASRYSSDLDSNDRCPNDFARRNRTGRRPNGRGRRLPSDPGWVG